MEGYCTPRPLHRLSLILLSIFYIHCTTSTYSFNNQSNATHDKICVQSSKSSLDGTYNWSYWDSSLNASGYYNSDTNISIYPFIKSDGARRYYIGSNISSTSMRAYCKLQNHSYSHIFDLNNCIRKWKIHTKNHVRLFVDDPTMIVTNCQPMCVSGNNYSAIDGTYVFTHFDVSINGSVYYCDSCGSFLYPHITETSNLTNYYWYIGPDYTARWSRCNLGNKPNSYIFKLDDCIGKWESYVSEQNWSRYVSSDILIRKCNYDISDDTIYEITISVSVISYIYFGAIILVIACVVGCKYKSIREKRRNNVKRINWDSVFDFNDIRSNFKSKESLQVYLSQQTWSEERIIFVLVLFVLSFINTYTNGNNFWRYHNEYLFTESDHWKDLSAVMALLEFMLSVIMILEAIAYFCIAGYAESVSAMVGLVPNISAMIYFTFVNTDALKSMICAAIHSGKSFFGKVSKAAVALLFGLLAAMMGLCIFVIKIQQISYIFERDWDTLNWSDFFVVVGVARQFAGLHTFGDKPYMGWYLGGIHPNKSKAMTQEDSEWEKKNDMDKIVCREMVEQYGFDGYLWLCYMFNSEDNVKKLYLKEYVDCDVDQTAYAQMTDNML